MGSKSAKRVRLCRIEELNMAVKADDANKGPVFSPKKGFSSSYFTRSGGKCDFYSEDRVCRLWEEGNCIFR
jgi:hypothetical protein